MTTFASGSETTCPICLSEMAVGDTIRTMRCQHMFHQACVDEWLRVNANCPTCRKRIDGGDDETDPLHSTPYQTTTTPNATTNTVSSTGNNNNSNNNNNTNSSSSGGAGSNNVILTSYFLRSSTDAAIR
jgi:hypothetical protein